MHLVLAVYGNNAMLLRRNVWSHSLLKDRLENYTRLEINKIPKNRPTTHLTQDPPKT